MISIINVNTFNFIQLFSSCNVIVLEKNLGKKTYVKLWRLLIRMSFAKVLLYLSEIVCFGKNSFHFHDIFYFQMWPAKNNNNNNNINNNNNDNNNNNNNNNNNISKK